jgi:hypothetical protein
MNTLLGIIGVMAVIAGSGIAGGLSIYGSIETFDGTAAWAASLVCVALVFSWAYGTTDAIIKAFIR